MRADATYLETAGARHGKPERVMHDRGAAFWSWRGISRFTSLLTEMGIDRVAAEHKEHNGKFALTSAGWYTLFWILKQIIKLLTGAEAAALLAGFIVWAIKLTELSLRYPGIQSELSHALPLQLQAQALA